MSLLVEVRIEEKSDVVHVNKMRSRTDIMASILKEAKTKTRKTRIMYGCNLSHRQLQRYLKLLLGMGMLRSFAERGSKETRFFKITEKGEKFLSAYGELKTLMSSRSMR